MSRAKAMLAERPFAFAAALAAVLLVANVVALPGWGAPDNWATVVTGFAPFALVAIACTPAVVAGDVDISIGPMAAFVNAVIVVWLLPGGLGSPEISIPLALLIGAALGLLNGVLVAVLGFQSIVATLCTFFVLMGATLKLAQTPVQAPANWTHHLTDSVGPLPVALLVIAVPAVVWVALSRTAYHRALYAVGSSEATSYSAGVNVVAVRLVAYVLGGVFAAVGGLALTALLQSTDVSVAQQYTLIAFAAISLGGTRVGGGNGGLTGAILGAASIYLLQALLSALNFQPGWTQVIYGALLVVGVILGARLSNVTGAEARS
jgi:ribose transport system permease protein